MPSEKIDIPQSMRIAIQRHQAGRLPEAETVYRRILASDPKHVEALYLLGVVSCQTGNTDQGIELFSQAIRHAPSNPFPYFYLGDAYQVSNRPEDAEACFRKALSIKPDFFDAYSNLGNVLKSCGRLEEAEACYRKALLLKPDLAMVQKNLGNILQDRGRHDEAETCYRKALELRSDYAEARWGLTTVKIPLVCGLKDDINVLRDEFSAELAELENWHEKNKSQEKNIELYPPFYLAYQEKNNRDLLVRYGNLCARLMERSVSGGNLTLKTGNPGIIRIGIVSAHIHDHSVWNAILKGWYLHLDRNRFELCTFYLDSKQDGETALAQSRSKQFEQGPKTFNQWVEAIRVLQLDVLVYPEIGMDPMTIKLASLRLAPVQAASWGHPETTGLPTMDYYLSAEDFEPPGAQENYSERLISLPHLGCCYQPSPVTLVNPDMARVDVEPGVPILICPGTPYKYAPRYDRVLVEIAKKVGRCRFVFFIPHMADLTEKLRHRLAAVFGESGLDLNEFASFIPWQPKPAFYGLMKRADVYLDTIGFSGFNTAMQALECGLPPVTREGHFMRGRLTSGILRRLGLPELIAATEEEYIMLALKLATDKDFRQGIRGRIEAGRNALYGDLEPVRSLEKFLAGTLKRG